MAVKTPARLGGRKAKSVASGTAGAASGAPTSNSSMAVKTPARRGGKRAGVGSSSRAAAGGGPTVGNGVPADDSSGPTTRSDRAASTRQSVLDAALEVFCEQTFGGARIEQIAERAGVAVGSIYKYFPGKQALVNEVFRYWKLKTREYSYAHAAGMTAKERFDAWADQLMRFAHDHPLAYEFLETHHHAAYLDEESRVAGDPMDRLALRLIQQGQKEGAIRSGDAAQLVAMVIGVFLGHVRELRARKMTAGDPAMFNFARICAWDLLRADHATEGGT